MASTTQIETTRQGEQVAAARSERTPPALIALTIWTLIMVGVGLYLALEYAPLERTMGAVQRIFYFHVGAAWAGALAFLVTAFSGVMFLATSKHKWDVVGHSAVEVGLALITMTLLSGPVWAQFAWGTPWTWDPKLTSAAVMWLSYAAYLMLRRGIEDPSRRERFAAVYGIVAFASVIMTFFGVRFINATIHPTVIGPSASTAQGDFGMTPRMLQTMIYSFITFTFVFATLIWYRIRLENFADRVNLIKMRFLAE